MELPSQANESSIRESKTYYYDQCKQQMDQLGAISENGFAAHLCDKLSNDNVITNHNESIPNNEYVLRLIQAREIVRLIDKGRGLAFREAKGMDTQFDTNRQLLITIINKYINIKTTEDTLIKTIDTIFRSLHRNNSNYVHQMTKGKRPKLAKVARATARNFIQAKMHAKMSESMFKQRMHVAPYKECIHWLFINTKWLEYIDLPESDGNSVRIYFSQDTANISENKIIDASKWCNKIFNYSTIKELNGSNKQRLETIFDSGRSNELVLELLSKIKHDKKKYYLPFVSILSESALDKYVMRKLRSYHAPTVPVGPSEKNQALQDKMDQLIIDNENNELLVEQLNNEKQTLIDKMDSMKLLLDNQTYQTLQQNKIIRDKNNEINQLQQQIQREKHQYCQWAKKNKHQLQQLMTSNQSLKNQLKEKDHLLQMQKQRIQQNQNMRSIPETPQQSYSSKHNRSRSNSNSYKHPFNSFANSNNNNNVHNNNSWDLLDHSFNELNVSNTSGLHISESDSG
eukprot:181037_1